MSRKTSRKRQKVEEIEKEDLSILKALVNSNISLFDSNNTLARFPGIAKKATRSMDLFKIMFRHTYPHSRANQSTFMMTKCTIILQ
ncbi:hypothetical protein B9Z55_027878 [Caenorhabditis nigoni]|uniref:Uncharacterized protein n=1 Tax=Caenorhabditis nigoni TaxID=1611254 RepID=A0A2G5SE78_9PELO|nr:hypothetical protein B9Z55_027878 [Caenorhabditis nigoni]